MTRRPATAADKSLALIVHHLAYREVVERQFGGWDEAEQDAYFDVAWPNHAHEMLTWDEEVWPPAQAGSTAASWPGRESSGSLAGWPVTASCE